MRDAKVRQIDDFMQIWAVSASALAPACTLDQESAELRKRNESVTPVSLRVNVRWFVSQLNACSPTKRTSLRRASSLSPSPPLQLPLNALGEPKVFRRPPVPYTTASLLIAERYGEWAPASSSSSTSGGHLLPAPTAMGNKSRAVAGGSNLLLGLIPLTGTAVACGLLLLIGALGYRVLEGTTWIDSLYASVGVLTTVGIVIPPSSTLSRLFTALLNLSSLGVAAQMLADIGDIRQSYARSVMRQGGVARSPRTDAFHSLLAGLPPLLLSSLVFSHFEGWDLLTSLYFATTNGTGLGMDGVYEPKHPISRLVFSVYIVIELGVMYQFLHAIAAIARNSAALAAAAAAATGTASNVGITSSVASMGGGDKGVHDDDYNDGEGTPENVVGVVGGGGGNNNKYRQDATETKGGK